ncbi:hypothetical protein ACIPJO_09630 [Streptomyces sp. NPDC086993]|uniref:hypothetical protein n=1 Tax=Streptomyces sp. NPDC086993 TaxID=3365765 RepID=UPI0037FB2DEE
MKNLLTGSDVFNHMAMLRSGTGKAYIFVEGGDDCGLIDSHLDRPNCDTVPSGGKVAVAEAIGIAESQGLSGVAAVLDRDWVGILQSETSTGRVFYTDFYDIDSLAFSRNRNVDGFISNFARKELVSQLAASLSGMSIWDVVIRIAFPIGVLRFLSEGNSWGLHLRDFPVHEVLDGEFTGIDSDALICEALGRSKKAKVSSEELKVRLDEEILRISDRYRYCSGHDLMAALAALVRHRLGSQVSAKVAGATIRAAFSCDDARQSNLFSSLARWGREEGISVLTCEKPSSL